MCSGLAAPLEEGVRLRVLRRRSGAGKRGRQGRVDSVRVDSAAVVAVSTACTGAGRCGRVRPSLEMAIGAVERRGRIGMEGLASERLSQASASLLACAVL